jgi:hypothetical protein
LLAGVKGQVFIDEVGVQSYRKCNKKNVWH